MPDVITDDRHVAVCGDFAIIHPTEESANAYVTEQSIATPWRTFSVKTFADFTSESAPSDPANNG